MSFSFGSYLASEKHAPHLELRLYMSPRKKPTHLDSEGLDEASCTIFIHSRAPSCDQHPRCTSNPLLGESESQNTHCLAEGSNEFPSYITTWDQGLKYFGKASRWALAWNWGVREDLRKPSVPSTKVHFWLPISGYPLLTQVLGH